MLCCGLLLCATGRPAAAQTNLQMWGDLSLNGLRSDRPAYALDPEPQALVANSDLDAASWRTFGVTPNVGYSAKRRLDVIAEVGTAVVTGPPSVLLPGEGAWQELPPVRAAGSANKRP